MLASEIILIIRVPGRRVDGCVWKKYGEGCLTCLLFAVVCAYLERKMPAGHCNLSVLINLNFVAIAVILMH